MSSYVITAEHRKQLLEDGYVPLPGGLPQDLLNRWRELAERLEVRALDAHARNESLHGACVIEDPVGPRLMRYDDVLGQDADAALDLLACPAMMAVARELCGCETVPLQMDLLYKHQHPHPATLWHQDSPHPRGYPYLNVGIYLDDAGQNDGCLHYVPGTQHELQDICGLTNTHGWDIPGIVQQPAKAGDILVQDMMGLVLRRAGAAEMAGAWQDDFLADLASDEEEISAILSLWEPPIPAVYCHYSVKTDDYPVPSDLQNPGPSQTDDKTN